MHNSSFLISPQQDSVKLLHFNLCPSCRIPQCQTCHPTCKNNNNKSFPSVSSAFSGLNSKNPNKWKPCCRQWAMERSYCELKCWKHSNFLFIQQQRQHTPPNAGGKSTVSFSVLTLNDLQMPKCRSLQTGLLNGHCANLVCKGPFAKSQPNYVQFWAFGPWLNRLAVGLMDVFPANQLSG